MHVWRPLWNNKTGTIIPQINGVKLSAQLYKMARIEKLGTVTDTQQVTQTLIRVKAAPSYSEQRTPPPEESPPPFDLEL